MDPNETLRKAREFAKILLNEQSGYEDKDALEFAVFGLLLAAAFEALDSWICRGGFLPDAWKR